MIRIPSDITLTKNARLVLEKRYLEKDSSGVVIGTPRGLFERVAKAVSGVETRQKSRWNDTFLEMMLSRRFLPNTPTLLNAGKDGGQLSACYVLPVDDTLEGIFDTLKHAARIHQSGGGTGFSFSRIREKGAAVGSSQGVASGPVSFMRIYDVATETIKQGGARRGANMAILRVDHPDIFEFIECKRDQRSILNFNISVGITREFMTALQLGQEFSLRRPVDGKIVRTVQAREIFERLVHAAWECGDPGLIFLDRIRFFNPTPEVGEMESTNPCGEQPLLAFESCNLGSLNLSEYFEEKNGVNWALFREDVRRAVRFLDNVIDLNEFPIEVCGKITRRNRKIGLGVMGLADVLLKMGVRYDSPEARGVGERFMSVLDREAKAQSADLAQRRGAFANFKGSLWDRLGYPPLRNATVSTVAPTGTISIIAGASSGIEPIFAGSFFRNVLSGERLQEVHPAVVKAIEKSGGDLNSVSEERISELLGGAWCPAQQVSVEGHLKMQAAFQRHSDSGVSKTINLPTVATREDVANAFLLAEKVGCKGITIYRDQSRDSQVLNHEVCVTCGEDSGEVPAN